MYLPFLHSCKPFSFVYVALCTCTRIRTHTDTHTRSQLQLLQAISNMRFCLHSYVCMQVCVVVCRTRPTFVYFYFGIDFKIKRRTFLDASVIQIPIPIFLLSPLSFFLSFYSRAFFLRRNFTTFALLTLCIQFYSFILPLLVNFILHLARAPTHTAYRTHTHTGTLTHSLTRQNSRLHVCMCRFVCRRIYVHVRRRRHTHL